METFGKSLRSIFLLWMLAIVLVIPSAHASNYYWVNGTGNWSDNFNHWALTSGGNTFHSTPPGLHDNVFFDVNSFAQAGDTVFMDAFTVSCNTMNWTGVQFTPVFYNSYQNIFQSYFNPFDYNLRLYGSLILDPNMIWEFSGKVGFVSNLAGNTIVSAGIPINADLAFNNVNGGWFLSDSLVTTKSVIVTNGNFNTNNHFVSCFSFETYSPVSSAYINLGTSEIRCIYQWSYQGASNKINATNATISFDNTSNSINNASSFWSTNSVLYHNVIFYGDARINLSSSSSFHIDKLVFEKNASIGFPNSIADTLIFNNPGFKISGRDMIGNIAGGKYTEINGSCNAFVTVEDVDFTQDSGVVIFNFCDFKQFTCTGNATFTANNCPPYAGVPVINFSPTLITDLYWIGNSGNWNDPAHWSTSSGGAGGVSCLPSAFTNVHIDSNSFSSPGQTITVDSSEKIYCRNFEWTNVQSGSAFFSEDSLSKLSIYGSLNLVYPINFNFRGSIVLRSDAFGNTIHTGNNLLNCEQFITDAFPTSTFILDDSLKVKGDVLTLSGNLLFSGNYLSCRYLNSSNSNLNGSTVELLDGFTGHFNGYGAKVYIHGSTQKLTATIHDFSGYIWMIECFGNLQVLSPLDASKIILHGNSTFNEAIIADTVIFNSPGKILGFTADLTYQINYLEANGDCNQLISILGAGNFTNLIDISDAQISYAFISNFPVTGNITVYNCKNHGGNTNVNFSSAPAKNIYWIGGSGRWDDPNHWSLTSGGPPATCAPTIDDHVFFDANSFTAFGQYVYVPQSFYRGCGSMDWTGAAYTPTMIFDTLDIGIFYMTGSLTLIPQMNWENRGLIEYGRTISGGTITSSGHDLSSAGIIFRTDGMFGYSLLDSLTCSGFLALYNGKFNSTNQSIHAGRIITTYSSPYPIQAFLGSSYIKLDGELHLNNSSGTQLLYLDSATIEANLAEIHDSLCTIGSLTIHFEYYGAGNYGHIKKLIIKGDAWLSDNAKFKLDTLLVNNPGFTVYIIDSLTADYVAINGDQGCEKWCTIQSNSTQNASLIVSTGFVFADYVALKSISAAGGAIFVADHCRDLGNNTGWSINSISGNKDYYWINGKGHWSDPLHWSLSSGGASAGCTPSDYDNVHFDANSFSSFGDTEFTEHYTKFNDMDWTGVQYNPSLFPGYWITAGGSLIVTPNVNLPYYCNIQFTANDSDNIIRFSGAPVNTSGGNQLRFSGSGLWQLDDSLSAEGYQFLFQNGTFKSNHYLVRAEIMDLIPTGSNKVQVDFGTSGIYTYGFTCKDTSIVDLNAIDANFYTGIFNGGDHQEYGYVESNIFSSDSCHIHMGICKGFQTYLPKYSNIDSLVFTNEVYLCEVSADTSFVSGKWIINNSPVQPILFKSQTAGISVITMMTNDTLCFDNLFLKDVHIVGGVTAFAGYNSVDLGNNSGWIFSSCAMSVDSIWPGDANYDLVVNNVDVLNIGVAYGESGPVRTNPVITWTPQFATDWSTNFNNGFNYKHADCNGDGLVDNNDTLAISLNYGQVHAYRLGGLPPQILTAPLLYLVSSVDTANLSQIVDIDVFLGLASLPVDSIYGIAFTINFNPALIDTTSVSFDYTGSWLGTAGSDMLTFEKVYASDGYADLAMVRTDHVNESGYGFLARMGVVIVDNVAGKITAPFTISNVTAITYNQTILDFNISGDSVDIDTSAILSIIQNPENEIRVFPVPARENLHIYSTGVKIEKIEMFSLFGEVMLSLQPRSNNYTINTEEFKNGVYILKCFTANGLINKKIEIIHR